MTAEWMDDAACRGVAGGEVNFFPRSSKAGDESPASMVVYERARKVCMVCPARVECLDYAMHLERHEADRFGMYGGLTPTERKGLARGAKWARQLAGRA